MPIDQDRKSQIALGMRKSNQQFLMRPILLLVLLMAGLQSSPASPGGSFSRTVINPEGGPATDAKVIVIQGNIETSEPQIITTGKTNSKGVFSGNARIPEHWERVWVSTLVMGSGSKVAYECKYLQKDKTPEAHLNITLTGSTSLKTRILGMDGKPIPNVRMRITQIAGSAPGGRIPFSQSVPDLPEGIWSAVSDADGRCVIERVPVGLRFYLSHDDPSLSQPYGEMSIYGSWKTPVSDGDEYEIILAKPGSVSGRILLPDGTPASNVEFNITESDPYVTSYRSSAWTDNDGRFHLPSVPPSNYRPRITLLPPLEAEWISAELPPVKVGDESPTVLPDITLIKVAEVTAEIVDAITGKTLQEPLTVRLPPGSHEISYRYHRIPPEGYLEGKYTLPVNVKAGDRKRITFKLDPVTDDHLIIGKVIDGNGAPVPDVAVALFASGSWGMSDPVRTGANGSFRIAQNDDLKGGFAIATNGVDSVSERVLAKPGVEMTLVLEKSGFVKVKGTVHDEAGKPIRKAVVRLSHNTLSSGFRPERVFGTILQQPTQTDESGKFSFDAVWAGFQDYNMKASADGFGDAWAESLSFSAGTTGEVNLTLKSAGESLRGTVVDADGTPVSGAWVNCSGNGQPGGIRQVVTDDKGQFVLEPLSKGAIYLNAGKYDEKSSREVNARAQVPCEPVRLVLPVADGVVRGRVVDGDGTPVVGAKVSGNLKNRKTVSDKNGNFQITGLMSGWFEIEATFEYENQTRTVARERVRPGIEDIVLILKPEKPYSRPLPEKPRNLIGQPATDIDVETWFNSPPHPAKAGGKVRILDFWGLGCAPCIATMPKIAKFWDKAPQDKIEIIALIGYYHDDEVREFLAKHPEYKFSFAKIRADSTTYHDYDIRYNPAYVVIAKDGKIVSYGSDWEKASVSALAELKKE